MFDGLRPMDWLFLLAALALGFGLVRFLLAHRAGQDKPPADDEPPPNDPPAR